MKNQDPLNPPDMRKNVNSGRPHSSKTIQFCPQPRSIISLKIRDERKLNCGKHCGIFARNDDKPEKSLMKNTDNGVEESNEPFISNCDDDYLSLNIKTKDNESSTYQCYDNGEQRDNFTKGITNGGNTHLDNKKLLEVPSQNYTNQGKDETKLPTTNNKFGSSTKIPRNICSYRCQGPEQLCNHIQTKASTSKFCCDFTGCSYATKISTNLTKHKRIHTKEKPYLCEQCTFRSNFISSLTVHKRIHTSDRPFCCEHCGYLCNSSSNLKKHCYHRHVL